MPFEKDVQERKHWWCPKWYWPFAVCSGIRTQHKWCYNFSWVKETRYGLAAHLEGCENGKLYTWTNFAVGAGSWTYPGGEMCFDSSLGADEGRCDASRVGLLASGLSASEPYASAIDYDILPINKTVAESGVFDFSGEHERLCQKGTWSWKRVLHEQVVVASVQTRFVQVQWYIGGVPTTGNSGTLSAGSFCNWPFPLLNGRSQSRNVKLRYEIMTTANKSTIKLFNDPADGCYSMALGMHAHEAGSLHGTSDVNVSFKGETCQFDPQRVAEMARCTKQFSDLSQEKAKSRIPTPGEPIVIFDEELERLKTDDNRALVEDLVSIARNSLHTDRELFTRSLDQLELQTGVADIYRVVSLRSPGPALPAGAMPQGVGVKMEQPLAVALVALGIGYLLGRQLGAPNRRLK